MEDSEKTWVKDLVSGDEAAFQKLFHNYYDQLVHFATRFTKSHDNAEGLVQEVFIKVWQNREFIDPQLSFKAYLYKITKNQALNFIRKTANEEKLKKELWHYIETSRNETEDKIFNDEYQGFITSALSDMTPQKQLIFKLSRSDGKSHKEIAAQLGISKSTVKNHVVEILQYLRKYLELHTDLTFSLVAIWIIS